MLSTRFALTALIVALFAAPVAAQQLPTSGAFVIRLGTDTFAVERFSRSGNAFNVEQVIRTPRTRLMHTHLELTPAGEIATIFLMQHQIGAMDAPLIASTQLTPKGDSATIEMKRGDSTRTRAVAFGRGMVPSLPVSFLPYEITAMRLRAAGGDSLRVVFAGPGGDQMPIIARRVGADSMTFELPFLIYRAHVDSEGRIQHLYLPLGTSVTRASAVDVNALASTWAALDSAGRGMGPLSPLDSASGRVGQATITVRYSRPSARGREVFGSLVQLDSVWRTGANAATILTTDRDLVIGDTNVPAGSYSLFTIPGRTESTLILNRETLRDGEPLAGTDRNPAQDFARIRMTTRTLPAPVERLTISVEPRQAGRGELRITWERREMTVPIRVR